MSSDFVKFATNIFEGTKYQASHTDIQKLASNMKILEDNDMSKLTRRLLEGGRKIWDTFAEHNFAVKLVSYHNQNAEISYEPDENLRRPPDFRIVKDELTYWIQMKRLSNLERENRQNKIVKKIKEGAKGIAIGMFFGCNLSEQFIEKDIPDLLDFLSANSSILKRVKNTVFRMRKTQKPLLTFGIQIKVKYPILL